MTNGAAAGGIGLSRRLRLLALAVLVAVSVVGCGSDDGTEVGSGGSGGSAGGTEPAFCDDARLIFQNPVDPAEVADRAEVPEAESVEMITAMADAAGGAEAGDLRELGAFMERFATDRDSLGPDDATRITELFRNVLAWSVRTCEPQTTVWACPSRKRFQPIGEVIGEPIAPDAGEHAPVDETNTPEDVASEQDDPDLRRVEVARDEERAVFAWLDDDGLAQKSVEVVNVRGTWTDAGTSECND